MANITDILKNRILVLDGAMGTMIQRYKLQEEDFILIYSKISVMNLLNSIILKNVTLNSIIIFHYEKKEYLKDR